MALRLLDPLRPMRPVPPCSECSRSEPPSGIRARASAETDLERFAGRVLAQHGRLARDMHVAEADAEDLLHDALLLLVENQEAVEAPARWSWFSATLRNRRMRLARDRAYAKKFEPLLDAHLRSLPQPFDLPDARLHEEQRRAAAQWLVAQVHASRRSVAELHLWEDRTLEEIAAEMGLPLGTIRSRWERAKEDMRAALEREQKKQGGFAWLVAIVALLSAAWLWLTGRGTAANVAGSARSSRRRHARTLLACAALPLFLAVEDRPLQPEIPTEAETSALNAKVEYTLHPYVNANAERELEWGNGRSGPGFDNWILDPEHETARGILTRANSAVARGDATTARQILRDYDENVPANFFAAQRAQLEASIRTLDATSSQRLP